LLHGASFKNIRQSGRTSQSLSGRYLPTPEPILWAHIARS
jgi:hypothetical protein